MDPPVVQFSLVDFSLVVVHPPVGVRGVAVLPHLLFHFLSFSHLILPNRMLISCPVIS